MRDKLKKSEFWSAMVILLLHMAVFPIALSLLASARPGLMTNAEMNLVYYIATTMLVFIFLGRYLRRSFDGLADAPGRCLSSIAVGWVLYMLLVIAVSGLISALGLGDNLNQESISSMLGQERGLIIAMTVFLAPIVEESLFRGGLFCGLYPKSRFAAYAVSMLLFCVYHVWQYAVALGDPGYLLMSIQYLPAAFVLCWVYERSGSVWTNIFFHMSVNAYAIFAASRLG